MKTKKPTSREQFEHWIQLPPIEREVERWPNTADQSWPGQYMDYDVQLAWDSWKESEKRFKTAAAKWKKDADGYLPQIKESVDKNVDCRHTKGFVEGMAKCYKEILETTTE